MLRVVPNLAGFYAGPQDEFRREYINREYTTQFPIETSSSKAFVNRE